jgi:arsenite methyltransferase
MKTEHELKVLVKEKYGQIALQSKAQNESSCCGATSCCGPSDAMDYTIMSESYEHLDGYAPDADLGLGCGLPTEFAQMQEGHTVVDLGSGAGNDCFIARAVVGDQGRVIGLDMTEAMVDKARQNAAKMGFDNVEFHLGDIENMPLETNLADVVVSNCVFNLVPDKQAALAETYRILKPGGHFSISDIVLQGEIPQELQEAAEMYAGCVSGAIPKEDYLGLIQKAGFQDIEVQKQRSIELPDSILSEYLTPEVLHEFRNSGTGIFSVNVFARKPLNNDN